MPETQTETKAEEKPLETLASDNSNIGERLAAIAASHKDDGEPATEASPVTASAPEIPADEWTEDSAPEPWLKSHAAAKKALESAAAKIREQGTRANQLQRELEQARIDRGVEESLKRREQQAAPSAEEKPKEDPRVARLKELRLIDPYGEEYERLQDELNTERIAAQAEKIYEQRERANKSQAYYADVNKAGRKALALVMERHGLDEATAGRVLVPVLQYYKEYVAGEGADLEVWRNPETFLTVAHQLNPFLSDRSTATAGTIQVPTVPQNTPAPPTSGKPAAPALTTKAAPAPSEKDQALANIFGDAANLSPEARERLQKRFARIA